MKQKILLFVLICFSACDQGNKKTIDGFAATDSSRIKEMVKQREQAMISRHIDSVMQQFDSNANFINGGGFYYEGFNEIRDFHNSMFTNDSLTYTYKVGKTFIKPISENVATVYYPWQQNWTMKNIQSDTLKETGLMTIIAIKIDGVWKWKSVTNQRTKDYFEDLKEHKARVIQ
jgi:hypothetical protein